MVSRLNASAVIHGDLLNNGKSETVLVATAASMEFRRDELTTEHFENKTCCEKQNLRICSEEFVEVVKINCLEVSCLNLSHQPLKLSPKCTTSEDGENQCSQIGSTCSEAEHLE